AVPSWFSFLLSFLLACIDSLRALPSFPTRRSSDLPAVVRRPAAYHARRGARDHGVVGHRAADHRARGDHDVPPEAGTRQDHRAGDRKSTRLNSSHVKISYAVFCLKKKITRARNQSM